jgi:hypothetical protein
VKMKCLLGVTALLLIGAPRFAAAEADFYVAPNGSDTNPGTAAAPLATVAKARDAVRRKVSAGLDHNVVVSIRGGVYPITETLVFGPEDSGTDKHSITYAAAPGEKVVLSGGRTITGWKKGPGNIWTTELPEVKAGKWYFRQLFVGGRRAVRARTPNVGQWWKLKPNDNNSNANDATVTLSVDHPIRAWKNVTDVEAIWLYNNDGTRKRLGSVRESDNTFTLPPPHAWPHGFTNEYNISFPGNRWTTWACYFENALEMLDQPGEWYMDRQTGVLSYWPREGEDLTRAEVVAPVLQKTLVSVQGTPERPVRNVHFRGIRVAYVDWPLPNYGFAGMFGCLQLLERKEAKNTWHFVFIDAAVSMSHARGCSFVDGAVEHVGAIGLTMLSGCSENVVEGNEIGDLGGGGIVAGGARNRDTWQWADPVGKDDHKAYRIANNHVHDCGADYFGSIGIFAALMQESVIAHNLIHDTSYAGMVLSGNEEPKPVMIPKNNRLEYNHIYNIMKVAMDGAAIYVSFPQADEGASIRGNVIHDTQRGAALYLDTVGRPHGCLGYKFRDNVVYRCNMPEVGTWTMEDNPWTDNIIMQQDAPPAKLVAALSACAGLEPAYRRRLLPGDAGPVCQRHRLAGDSFDLSVWSAEQFDWPGKGEGVVLAFRRDKNTEPTQTFRLTGLDRAAQYELTDLQAKTTKKATGSELMERGVTVTIPVKPAEQHTFDDWWGGHWRVPKSNSVVIEYRKL